VQLIAKSLLEQFAPQMEPLGDYFQSDNGTHREFARQIDEALAMRDLNAIRISYDNMSNYFREQFIVAFDAFEAAQQPASMEASAT
jgi:hypothetical protein